MNREFTTSDFSKTLIALSLPPVVDGIEAFHSKLGECIDAHLTDQVSIVCIESLSVKL